MELAEDHQNLESLSSPSFIDTEFEEHPESPEDQDMDNNFSLNNYDRPTAAILPNPR